MIAAFSGSLFLFLRAFLCPGGHDYHLASLNLTHLNPTLLVNLSTAKPRALHKASLPVWALVDNNKNEGSDMPPISLKSDSMQLGGDSQVVAHSLEPVTRNNLLDWGINRSFSSRFLSNPQSRPSYSNQNSVFDKNFDNIHDSESRHVFDPGYDPLELEPFFSLEDSDDRVQTFALKIWLDPKDFSRAKIGNVEICQASRGVKCWPDIPTHHGV